MSILMMLILLMAIIYGVEYSVSKEDGGEGSSANIGNHFLYNVGLFYQFMLGQNPYLEMNKTAWIVYVIFTMLV